jgi:exosome complex component RRP4
MSEKRIILPGERITEGKYKIPGGFVEGESTYAAVMGMLDEGNRFIPLENKYRPFREDILIGVVTDSRHAGYSVDINLPKEGFIPSRDTRIRLELGDFVFCKIKSVNEVGDVDLAEVRRLPKGKVVKFPPAKVPRLVGRQSSMINMFKENVGDIMVGKNGYVWISENANIPLALKAIDMIEDQAHMSGLTDRVAEFFANEKGE